MKNDRGEKTNKNNSLLQWFAFLFILGSVAFSGFTLWEVHNMQSEVTRHEYAVEILNAIYEPITDMYESVGEFDKNLIEMDYLANESVNIGSMTIAEADTMIEAAAKSYRTTLQGKFFMIDQIFTAYGIEDNLGVLEALSPGISSMFNNGTSTMLFFYWVNPNYELVWPYTTWNFFTYFNNSAIETLDYASMLDLIYPNTAAILNSTFWWEGSPPYTTGYAVQKLPLYVRENHTQPMLQIQNQIQSYILGNGINAVAVLVLSFVANFDDKLLFKIISLVIAVGLLGFSAVSIVFL